MASCRCFWTWICGPGRWQSLSFGSSCFGSGSCTSTFTSSACVYSITKSAMTFSRTASISMLPSYRRAQRCQDGGQTARCDGWRCLRFRWRIFSCSSSQRFTRTPRCFSLADPSIIFPLPSRVSAVQRVPRRQQQNRRLSQRQFTPKTRMSKCELWLEQWISNLVYPLFDPCYFYTKDRNACWISGRRWAKRQSCPLRLDASAKVCSWWLTYAWWLTYVSRHMQDQIGLKKPLELWVSPHVFYFFRVRIFGGNATVVNCCHDFFAGAVKLFWLRQCLLIV